MKAFVKKGKVVATHRDDQEISYEGAEMVVLPDETVIDWGNPVDPRLWMKQEDKDSVERETKIRQEMDKLLREQAIQSLIDKGEISG